MSKLVIGSSKTNIVPAIVRDVSPAYYIPLNKTSGNKLVRVAGLPSFEGVTDISDKLFYYAYEKTSGWDSSIVFDNLLQITGAESFSHTFSYASGIVNCVFPSVVSITGNLAFSGCFERVSSLTSCTFPSLTTVGSYAFYYAFTRTNLTTVDFSKITTIGGSYGFGNAFEYTPLTIMNWFPNLETVTGNNVFAFAFRYCNNLTTADFAKLTTLTGFQCLGGMFMNCDYLTTVYLKELTTLTGQAALGSGFRQCSRLKELKFPSLHIANSHQAFENMCEGNSNMTVWFFAFTPNSFGTQTSQFYQMFRSGSNNTVHFPISIQSVIGSWSDIVNGCSGTNTSVLFDIVTSLEGANSETYTRQEKNSTSTATAWINNDVLYYTSGISDNTHGVNEPQVGDTIYSDAACTTAVTTISTIA